jgi:FtsZ-binding cell division protein ZapB
MTVDRLEQIGREITARVEKLDKLGTRAIDQVDSIDHLLAEAEKLCETAEAFEAFKHKHCPDLGRSRTYELLAIKEGRKTLDGIRAATRARVAKHRAGKKAVTDNRPLHSAPDLDLPSPIATEVAPLSTETLITKINDGIRKADVLQAVVDECSEKARELEHKADQLKAEAASLEAEEHAKDDPDDDMPERTITKAELMAALRVILRCKFEPRDDYSSAGVRNGRF